MPLNGSSFGQRPWTITGYIARGLSATFKSTSHLNMPWPTMAVLLLLFALVPSIDAFIRAKRQYSPSAQLQQWSVDQQSYQQPLGYRETFAGTDDYYPDTNYYNYYPQRAIVPHQAPNSWTLDGYTSYSYAYPSSSYNNHQWSGYAIKPDSNAANSYDKAYVSGEVTQTPSKSNIPTDAVTQSKDEYPTAPPVWEGGPSERFFAKGFLVTNEPSQSTEASTKSTKLLRYFEGEGFDENGPFASHGVEVIGEGDSTGLDDFYLKAAVEEDINETENFSPSTPSEEKTEKPSSTTSNPHGEELTPGSSDPNKKLVEIIEKITTTSSPDDSSTTPQRVTEEETALFVDGEDSFDYTSTESITGTPESNNVADTSISTEVPSTYVTEESTESTSLPNSNNTVILRSPPLPIQVAEKLKELGFSVLRFFS